jgi:ABC-type uncharacterized transport system ATPase subunit
VLAQGAVAELKASLHRDVVIRIEGVISAKATEAVQALSGVNRAATVAVNGHSQLTVVTENQQALLPRLIETLTQHSAVMQKITPEEVTLEDVFIARTGRTLADDTRVK